jgi:hypothetical protein
MLHLDSKWNWRRCVTLRITGGSDFLHRLVLWKLENTAFRKVDLFPSSSEGETPPLLGLMERANLNHWTILVRVRIRVKVKVTLRLAVFPQLVRPGVKPLETHDQIFLQLNPCEHSPYVTSSLTRRWVCLLWICLAFVKCTYRTYSLLLKILTFALYASPLSVEALQSRSCYLTDLMLQRQFSHLNGRKLDHGQVWTSYIFNVWLRLVLYSEQPTSDLNTWGQAMSRRESRKICNKNCDKARAFVELGYRGRNLCYKPSQQTKSMNINE